MSLSNLEKLIWLICAYRSNGILTKPLAKLLYLIDLAFAQSRGETLTGVEWRYHYYGPYAFDMDDAVNALEQHGLLQCTRSVTIHSTRPYTVHFARPGVGYPGLFDPEDETLVMEQLLRYGGLDGDALTEESYNTIPMLNADRGEVLDMTKEYRKEQSLKRAGVPVDELKALASKVDRSVRGTDEERAAHTLEVFNEMSVARKRATAARLSDE